MPLVFENNLLYAPPRKNVAPIPVWLPIAGDPRPTCCLLVGDGFTHSLLRASGLADKVFCSIDSILPSHSDAEYLPVDGDRFERSKLWDEEKWPRLCKLHADTGLSGRDLFRKLSLTTFNPTREKGLWSFSTGTLEYELRCYLWHLFRSYQDKFSSELRLTTEWPWLRVLHYCLSEFKVHVISFNYDTWLELILHNALHFGDEYYSVPLVPSGRAASVEPILLPRWQRDHRQTTWLHLASLGSSRRPKAGSESLA